ncbi:MAG TPA: hypothetical protein VG222_16125, partial [Vicinamibacterales bacterium]|nr:hypothetical protein [Vicinamibacterales bacterium]
MFLRKLLLSCVLVIAGFAAGLVLTGRMRTASDSRADTVAATPAAPAVERPARPGAAVATLGGPDFTRIAGQAVKGVANISSLQVVRTASSPLANDPFFRYFFGDDDA